MNSDGHIYMDSTALKDLTDEQRERVQEASPAQLQRIMSKPGVKSLSMDEVKDLLKLPRRERLAKLVELRRRSQEKRR